MEFPRIEIIPGCFGHEYTDIAPVREKPDSLFGYEKKTDDQISVSEMYISGYIEFLLNQQYKTETQLDADARVFDGYDCYGWNCYTPEQIRRILDGLRSFISAVSKDPFDPAYVEYYTPRKKEGAEKQDYIRGKAAQLVDFYERLIPCIEKMLNNMDGYDLVMFEGP